MKDQINRRLLIIFGLCILLSLGAIAIGVLGMIDVIDTGVVPTVLGWLEPVIAIRSEGPEQDPEASVQSGPSAMDLEATRQVQELAAIAERYTDWATVLEEPFQENAIEWPEFEDEDELARLKVEVVGGKYRWDAVAKDGFIWWSYPDMEALTDFYAEVEAVQLEGDFYGEMGLVFRLDENRFYIFEVSGEYYSLWRSIPDGWEELIAWTESDSIIPGEVNDIGVLVIGDQIWLLINNRLVAELRDDHYAAGVVGLAIGLDDAGDTGIFEFDNLRITAP